MMLTREEENLLDILKLEQIIEIFSVSRNKINIRFLLMQVNVKDLIQVINGLILVG